MAYVCTVVDDVRGGWAVYAGLAKQAWPKVIRGWLVNGDGYWRASRPDDVRVDVQLLSDDEVVDETLGAFITGAAVHGVDRCVNDFVDRLPVASAVEALATDDPLGELRRRLTELGDWRPCALGQPGRTPVVTAPSMVDQVGGRRTGMHTRLADPSLEALRREERRRTPCVYEVLLDGVCVYVGSARRSLLRRLAKHAADDHSPLRPLIAERGLEHFRIALLQECSTRAEALRAEYVWSARRAAQGCRLLNDRFGAHTPAHARPEGRQAVRGTDLLCTATGVRFNSVAAVVAETGRRPGAAFRRTPAVRVVCLTTGEEFADAVDAAEAHGLRPMDVHHAVCAHGEAGGLAWAAPPLATTTLQGVGPRPVLCPETGDVFESVVVCADVHGVPASTLYGVVDEGRELAVDGRLLHLRRVTDGELAQLRSNALRGWWTCRGLSV